MADEPKEKRQETDPVPLFRDTPPKSPPEEKHAPLGFETAAVHLSEDLFARISADLFQTEAPVTSSLLDALRALDAKPKEDSQRIRFARREDPAAPQMATAEPGTSVETAIDQEESEHELVKRVRTLHRSGIDPAVFDVLLTNEVNRRLKIQFGKSFLWVAIGFTAASYLIVVLNSVLSWQIPDKAIMALIVQAPIQLIGLLYIMARNLFPSSPAEAQCGRRKV